MRVGPESSKATRSGSAQRTASGERTGQGTPDGRNLVSANRIRGMTLGVIERLSLPIIRTPLSACISQEVSK